MGETAAAEALMTAVEKVTVSGAGTPDMGGKLSTAELAKAVQGAL
ncbi:hypothetical protein [Marinobacterium aestuariivivens]|uniref:Isopropylmalate dehydrogenase-like domain-containing protein n=1 Tax=Marinobacterium aestuariivivens TaxID=1698799 RepID=A0ABW2A295_9GAMM